MVVAMLETMRILVTSEETFEHPVVFLFNGAEEQPLQGSHAFISQHKWSPNCKLVLSLYWRCQSFYLYICLSS